MEIVPKLRSTQIAYLEPGDLFSMHHTTGVYYALAVMESNSKDKQVLLLGPPSPDSPPLPLLTSFSQQMQVVSFGKNYNFRLPFRATDWLDIEPKEGTCIVLTEDKVYMRAHVRGSNDIVYVSIKEGLLFKESGRVAHPGVNSAFTSEWKFLTAEENAQVILSSSGNASG